MIWLHLLIRVMRPAVLLVCRLVQRSFPPFLTVPSPVPGAAEGGAPHDPFGIVEDMDKARKELSEQLSQLQKTDKVVDVLISKAQGQRENDRLERHVAELVESQDKAQDVKHEANKMYKFNKTKDGQLATAMDFKNATSRVRDAVNLMIADTKAVRAFLPKVNKLTQ